MSGIQRRILYIDSFGDINSAGFLKKIIYCSAVVLNPDLSAKLHSSAIIGIVDGRSKMNKLVPRIILAITTSVEIISFCRNFPPPSRYDAHKRIKSKSNARI